MMGNPRLRVVGVPIMVFTVVNQLGSPGRQLASTPSPQKSSPSDWPPQGNILISPPLFFPWQLEVIEMPIEKPAIIFVRNIAI